MVHFQTEQRHSPRSDDRSPLPKNKSFSYPAGNEIQYVAEEMQTFHADGFEWIENMVCLRGLAAAFHTLPLQNFLFPS